MLRDLSIAWRMTLLAVLGAAAVLIGASVSTYAATRDMLDRRQQVQMTQTLQATADRIETAESRVEEVVQGLALAIEGLPPDARRAKALLRRTVAREPSLVGASIEYDPAAYGRASLHAYRTAEGVRVVELGAGSPVSATEDWFRLFDRTREPVWTDPRYEKSDTGTVTAIYAVPVRLAGGPPVSAVVTGEVSLDWLDNLLEGLDLGEAGYAFLISRTGVLIAHPGGRSLVGESIFDIAKARRDPRLRAIGRRMIRGGTGFVEIDDFEGLKRGDVSYLAFTSVPATGWALGIAYADSEVRADLLTLSRIQWTVSLVGVAGLVLVVWLAARTITRPLKALDAATHTLAEGHLDAPLPEARGRDEVAHLTRSFGRMRDDLERHIEELRESTARRERIESELRIAADIQMSLVPRRFPPFPERNDLDLHAVLRPAREVGGDFYDFFLLDDDHLCLAIADVSDKGVPAALLMAGARSFLRPFAREGGGPAAVLGKVNQELAVDNEACMFVTMFLALADLRTGVVRCASAGHNPPLLVAADGTVTQPPRVKGVALGVTAEAVFEEAEVRLRRGETLFLYTDGVTEAMDAAGHIFGDHRLGDVLAAAAGTDCAGIIDAVLAAVARHAREAEQSDDITMLAFRYLGH